MRWDTLCLLAGAGGFASYQIPWRWETQTAGEASFFLVCAAMVADLMEDNQNIFLRSCIPAVCGYTAGTLIQWM